MAARTDHLPGDIVEAEEWNDLAGEVNAIPAKVETAVANSAGIAAAAADADAAQVAAAAAQARADLIPQDVQDALADDAVVVQAAADAATARINAEDLTTKAQVAAGYVARFGTTRWPGAGRRTGGLYLYEGDSLTDGAAASSFRPDVERAARGAMGDGGPGFHNFSNGQRVDRNADAGWTSVAEFSAGDGSTEGGLFFGGLRSTADGMTFNWAPTSRWDTGVFLYLKKPGGGTFVLKTSAMRGGESVTINTGTVNADGTGGAVADYALGSVALTNPGGAYCSVSVTGNVGSVVILGCDFRNALAPSGYRYGTLAAGGKTLAQYASVRADIRQAFAALLNPAAHVINLGMNDRGGANAATHEANLTTIVNAMQAGAPTCAEWIVQSNEPSDAATTNFLSYVQAKQNVALAKGAGFYDERSVMGTYAQAVAAGLMADGVHPNAAGNERRASGLLAALGIPAAGSDPGPTPVQSTSVTSEAQRGTLTQKRIALAAGALSQVIYRLGVASNYGQALFELEVHSERTGTSASALQVFRFVLANSVGGSNNGGQATLTSAVAKQTLFQGPPPGDAGLPDATISVAIVANVAEVTLTGVYAGAQVITGRWLTTGAAISGRRVWES